MPNTYARRFQDLTVYQRSRELARSVFQLTKRFPADERYSLTDQIRRAARSIGAQIAESWAKRGYPKHFTSKLTDADSEQLEVQHWLLISKDAEYLTADEYRSLFSRCDEIGKMLGRMIEIPESFCESETARVKEGEDHFYTADSQNLNTEY